LFPYFSARGNSANIFMGDLEERLLLSSLKQPHSWLRFIDDADMKWIHSDKEIDDFFEHANSIHPTMEHIRFTLMAWMNGILLKQCLGWQQLGERY
jgi:hypothetical protein